MNYDKPTKKEEDFWDRYQRLVDEMISENYNIEEIAALAAINEEYNFEHVEV